MSDSIRYVVVEVVDGVPQREPFEAFGSPGLHSSRFDAARWLYDAYYCHLPSSHRGPTDEQAKDFIRSHARGGILSRELDRCELRRFAIREVLVSNDAQLLTPAEQRAAWGYCTSESDFQRIQGQDEQGDSALAGANQQLKELVEGNLVTIRGRRKEIGDARYTRNDIEKTSQTLLAVAAKYS